MIGRRGFLKTMLGGLAAAPLVRFLPPLEGPDAAPEATFGLDWGSADRALVVLVRWDTADRLHVKVYDPERDAGVEQEA